MPREPKSRLDRAIAQLVAENGIPDVIAALARLCEAHGREPVAGPLKRLHARLTAHSKKNAP